MTTYPPLNEDESMTDDSPGPVNPSRPATPRWVKALALAAVITVIVSAVAMLAMGGEHGPGRHSAWSVQVQTL